MHKEEKRECCRESIRELGPSSLFSSVSSWSPPLLFVESWKFVVVTWDFACELTFVESFVPVQQTNRYQQKSIISLPTQVHLWMHSLQVSLFVFVFCDVVFPPFFISLNLGSVSWTFRPLGIERLHG
jgi:hypothetical protein